MMILVKLRAYTDLYRILPADSKSGDRLSDPVASHLRRRGFHQGGEHPEAVSAPGKAVMASESIPACGGDRKNPDRTDPDCLGRRFRQTPQILSDVANNFAIIGGGHSRAALPGFINDKSG
jgi:hypothetical protein